MSGSEDSDPRHLFYYARVAVGVVLVVLIVQQMNRETPIDSVQLFAILGTVLALLSVDGWRTLFK